MNEEHSYSSHRHIPHNGLWIRLWRRHSVKLGCCILALVFSLAIFGPLYSSYLPSEIQLIYKNHPPCSKFWFGTDELGRDLFVRVCWGARISLFIGILATLIDTLIGVLWAAFVVQIGGKWEEYLMRICDILHSIPYLLLAMFLTLVRGAGLTTVLMAITMTGWIQMARILRPHMLQLKRQDYILMATALGASPSRIIFHYLIPNSISLILITMTQSVPAAIFTEAFLSFLGLGLQVPTASWGAMINDGIGAMNYYPWRLLFPAFFITLTTLAFHLLGQGFRDVLEER